MKMQMKILVERRTCPAISLRARALPTAPPALTSWGMGKHLMESESTEIRIPVIREYRISKADRRGEIEFRKK